MITRRQLVKNIVMGGIGTAGALIAKPMLALAGGECDAMGNCVVGIATNVLNQVDAKQKSSQWCWAASAQMILNYYQIPATQEEIVLRIKGAFVDEAANYLEILEALNGRATDKNGNTKRIQCQTMGITVGNILVDLYEDRPLLLAYDTGEGGHAVVLTAVTFRTYETDAGTDFDLVSVTVRDPWPTRPSRQTWSAAQLAARTSFMARVTVEDV
jgi:hypothetical protein